MSELWGPLISMGAKLDNNIFKHLLKKVLLHEVQILRATWRTVSLSVDDAISTLPSIFGIVRVVFTLLFYGLTERRSIDCPPVLIYRRSLESHWPFIALNFGITKSCINICGPARQKKPFKEIQKDSGEPETRILRCLLLLYGWGCAI